MGALIPSYFPYYFSNFGSLPQAEVIPGEILNTGRRTSRTIYTDINAANPKSVAEQEPVGTEGRFKTARSE